MDNSVERQTSGMQQQSRFFTSLQIFERIMNWLADLTQLTEDEQREAGIFIGRQGDE